MTDTDKVEVLNCIKESLEEAKADIAKLVRQARSQCANDNCLPWETLEWQRVKGIIASAVAECICSILGCSVYRLEMHGGEPSLGLGDKDVDLAVDCRQDINIEDFEADIESLVGEFLGRVIGEDIYKAIRLPNIVELHTTREFLIKRYVEAGPPLAFRLC